MSLVAGLPPAMPEWQAERDKKNKFLHWLRSHGFLVVAKDGSPQDASHYKANVDVMIAVEATEMAVERTRLLYQGSLLPTLFMLINGLVCAALLWEPSRYFLVSVWLVWLLSLVALRGIQVAAFDSAMPSRQAHPVVSSSICRWAA